MLKANLILSVTTAIVFGGLSSPAGAISAARLSVISSTDRAIQPVHEGHHKAAQGSGLVNAVDTERRKISINHGPIQAFGWPAMTTEFAVDPSVDLGSLKPRMKVDFSVTKAGDGSYVVESVKSAAEH